MPDLVHLVYASEAVVELSDEAVRTLLVRARQNNASCGVTGILLHTGRSFFQVLEGEPVNVEALYEKISRDQRHRHVVRLIAEPIVRRDFSDWAMGLAKLTSADLGGMPGITDFFTSRR